MGHEEVACDTRRCMGRCGYGPNVEVIGPGGRPNIVSGLRSYDLVERCVTSSAPSVRIDGLARKIARLKFDARREQNREARQRLIAEAFAALGSQEAAAGQPLHARLLSQLLVMRAREALDTAQRGGMPFGAALCDVAPRAVDHGATDCRLEAALADAERAVALAPSWRSARVVMGDLLEALGRPRGDSSRGALDEPELQGWRVEAVRRVNHNCVLLSLSGAGGDCEVGEVWHVDVVGNVGDESTGAGCPDVYIEPSPASSSSADAVVRSYTPLSSVADYRAGRLELFVKVYPNGRLTPYLAALSSGASLQVSAPVSTLDPAAFTGVLVVAGGSAVTVALQVCEAVLQRHPKRGKVRLVLCNHSLEDVVFVERLEALLSNYSGFRIVHCVATGPLPPRGRKGRAEWFSGRLAAQALGGIEPHLKAVVSGPPGLCKAAVALLGSLGLGGGEAPLVLDDIPGEGVAGAPDHAGSLEAPKFVSADALPGATNGNVKLHMKVTAPIQAKMSADAVDSVAREPLSSPRQSLRCCAPLW